MNNMYDILAKLNSVEKQNLTEGKRPDFLDLDKDGDKEESMKKAADDAEKDKKVEESILKITNLWKAYRG